MQFVLTEEQGLLRDQVRGLLEKRAAPFLLDIDEYDGLFSTPNRDRDSVFYQYLWSAAMRIAGGADEVLR